MRKGQEAEVIRREKDGSGMDESGVSFPLFFPSGFLLKNIATSLNSKKEDQNHKVQKFSVK
jgi:hypothetical protein